MKEGPTTVDDFPDHLLDMIFLRLGNYQCLVGAAAACRRWRRLVANAGFLAQFGSLHAPRIVGEYLTVGGRHRFVPSSPSPARLSRHFSLDFLPDNISWDIVDSRGSLLLLSRARNDGLIVCEPLTQCYQRIDFPPYFTYPWRGNVFLADGADADHRIGMSNYRVIVADRHTRAWVFSSGSHDGWQHVVSVVNLNNPPSYLSFFFVGRANGSLYWGINEDKDVGDRMLVLDEATAKFSVTVVPHNSWGKYKQNTTRVIGGEDGGLRLVHLTDNILKVFLHRPGNKNKWVVEKLLRLAEATVGLRGRQERFFDSAARIIDANDKYILVTPIEKKWAFTVKLDTMQVDRKHKRNRYVTDVFPYEVPWPPVFQLKA